MIERDRDTSRAIQVTTRAAPIVAALVGLSYGVPALGPYASGLAFLAEFGVWSAGPWIRSARARRALNSIVRDPNLSVDEYVLRMRERPDVETLKREILCDLREMDNVIDGAIVDPLIAILQLRIKDPGATQFSDAMNAFLRRLRAGHLDELRRAFRAALLHSHDRRVTFWDNVELSVGGAGLAVSDAETGVQTGLVGLQHMRKLFRLLKEADLAEESATSVGTYQGFPKAQGASMLMKREMIERVLLIVGDR